ncbi:YkvA family protein [Pelosinus sp. UFO1]|uniref:YkvA family protein n=1 Tax=Pelosinus sp. UFO1 TaxID=484770 RepID=UPI0004D1A338|nr:DUF1232 domain-containing protein [Pelosinus sp. UFO1]AIF53987.1 protein of unknown function DUF1232 [Pelosinus sp. UFO1]
MDDKDYDTYAEKYSEKKLFEKIGRFAAKAGKKLVYVVLLLYYTLQKDNVPMKAKAIIIGVLGYFISPIDAIPDITPFIGYTDDFGALLVALAVVSVYVDEEVKNKAKSKLESWFGPISESDIEEINAKL